MTFLKTLPEIIITFCVIVFWQNLGFPINFHHLNLRISRSYCVPLVLGTTVTHSIFCGFLNSLFNRKYLLAILVRALDFIIYTFELILVRGISRNLYCIHKFMEGRVCGFFASLIEITIQLEVIEEVYKMGFSWN